jgi:4-hydroxy-2-oxoheptanedioate aldolase
MQATSSPRTSNKTKLKLSQGHTCFGITIRFPSDQVIEIAAATGCDFVIFDIEHEGFAMDELVSMIRTADLAGITPIARVGRGYPALIDPLLSAGVQGFSLARVKSSADISEICDMIYYYPKGKRTSYPLGRNNKFGVGMDADAWRDQLNEQLLLHVIVEEKDAIDNLDEILAHPLLDVVECGPSDLRLSLGLPPAEQVARIEEQVFARSVAAGKFILETVAGHALTPRVWKEVRPGHGTMIVGSASGILTSAMAGMVAEVAARTKPRTES